MLHRTIPIQPTCRYGRRFAMSRLLVLSGACLVCSFVVSDVLRSTSPILSFSSRIGFAVLGKVLVSAVFAVAYFFTSELFPTEVRSVVSAVILNPMVYCSMQVYVQCVLCIWAVILQYCNLAPLRGVLTVYAVWIKHNISALRMSSVMIRDTSVVRTPL